MRLPNHNRTTQGLKNFNTTIESSKLEITLESIILTSLSCKSYVKDLE